MDDYILTYRLDYSGLLSPIDTSQDPLAREPTSPPPAGSSGDYQTATYDNFTYDNA